MNKQDVFLVFNVVIMLREKERLVKKGKYCLQRHLCQLYKKVYQPMLRYSPHCVQYQDELIARQDIEQPADSNFKVLPL